jgi:hypothetical protein
MTEFKQYMLGLALITAAVAFFVLVISPRCA